MYKKYAESENWKAQMTEESIGDEGGYKNCVIEVTFALTAIRAA